MGTSTQRPVLRRVLPVGHEFTRHDGSRLVVTSVDLWSDSLVIHTVTLVEGADAFARRSLDGRLVASGGVLVSDDVGTTYSGTGGGGGGTQNRLFTTMPYQPTPPPSANTLFLRDPGTGAEVPVAL